MASIVLGTVGRAVGTAVGGPAGGYIGSAIGSSLGAGLDGGRGNKRHYEGARLEELAVQSSSYGKMIPIVFGTMRLAGNMIWARPLKELETTTSVSQGGKGGSRKKVTSTSTSYSYYATVAIAICEGEITRISRVWADAKLLDLSQGTYRLYRGTNDQLPDPLIESFEGVGNTPAYRGLAYVVIEDFPIGDFGNRIPNFTFEVVRHTPQKDVHAQPVESLVTSVMLIPGSGEFVYDTQVATKANGTIVSGNFVQEGYNIALNRHTAEGVANIQVALDQMQQTFPNLEWVGVAANWFGDSMDIASCHIKPRVEFSTNVQITPQAWQVAGLTRSSAPLVGNDEGMPRFGGTPDDASLVRLCEALRARGLKIFFYPMLQMDLPGKPWRGFLTGGPTQVGSFFTRAWGYRQFILHYATLVAGKVDAFAIGSELRDLTGIANGDGVYPAVDELVTLAGLVRGVLGSGVKLTYAADWSEYHHADGGWYHLDPLWASPAIDMVGIDAYFPLTEGVQTGYDMQAIRDGWENGEGYDYYYTDAGRTLTAPLAPAYAWKNIGWWWSHAHTNPNGSGTAWVPESKPIWFTEYGFASVDGCSNEPNRFIDAGSAESAFPRFSRGRVDFMAQRTAIAATEAQWADSPMVVNKFLWTWDARPYPYWPDLRSIWADGANWVTGHWVQGKLGASHVAAAVEQIAARVGIGPEQLDTSVLQMILEGFVIHQRTTARGAISQLMQAYFFTLREGKAGMEALLRDQASPLVVNRQDCIPMTVGERQVAYTMERQEELALPDRIEVQSLNRLQLYETQVQSANRATQGSREVQSMQLGLVLSQTHATSIAEMALMQRWSERCRVTLQLPLRFAALEPGDRLLLQDGTQEHVLRVEQVQFGRPGMLRITALNTQAEPWDGYIAPTTDGGVEALLPPPPTHLEWLEIPAFGSDAQDVYTVRLAACGTSEGWRGAAIIRQSGYGEDMVIAEMERPATIGRSVTVLGDAMAELVDRQSSVEVALLGTGQLASVSEEALWAGANLALLGDELLQFAEAVLIGENRYRLSRFLRGRKGTERFTAGHAANERFVLLDSALVPLLPGTANIGQLWQARAVSVGDQFSGGTAEDHALSGASLKPYAPVRLRAVRSGGDVTLSWVRRTRIGGGLRDGVDVPLMEQEEAYEVRIMSGASVLRSWRTGSPWQLYSSTQQMADFGSLPSDITVAVAQISAWVGVGHFATQTLTIS